LIRFISKRLRSSFQFGDSSALTSVPLAMLYGSSPSRRQWKDADVAKRLGVSIDQ
jgi:hypothetical protein